MDHDTSEQEPLSPSRKRSAGQMNTNNFTAKELDDGGSSGSSSTKQYKNGHYELVDSSRTPSLKRSITITYKHTSSADVWNNTGHCHHQHSLKHPNATTTVPQIPETNVVRNIRVHQKSLSNRISSLKRENKTTQTLSIVVGGFIACWLPFFIYYLITPFLPVDKFSKTLAEFLTWLGWFNSAINPFIYAFYSVDFRAAFWRLTLRRFFKNSRKAPYASTTMSIRR